MKLFEERFTLGLWDKGNDSIHCDAVLRIIVHNGNDPHSRIEFHVMRNDGKSSKFGFGLGWRRDIAGIESVLGNTGYDLTHGDGAPPLLVLKAWLFDLLARKF